MLNIANKTIHIKIIIKILPDPEKIENVKEYELKLIKKVNKH